MTNLILIMLVVFVVLALSNASDVYSVLEPEECDQWELPAPPQCARMVLTLDEWCHANTLVWYDWCDYKR